MSPRKGPCQKKNFKPLFLRGHVSFRKNTVYIVTLLKASAIRRDMITININFVRKLLEKVTIFAKMCLQISPCHLLPSFQELCCHISPHDFEAMAMFSLWLQKPREGGVSVVPPWTWKCWQAFLFPQRSLMFFVFACVDLWVFVEDNPSLVNYRKLITFRVFHFLLHSYLILCSLQLCLPSEFSYMYLIYNDPLWTTPKNPDFQVSVEVKKILSKSKFFKQSQSLIGGFNPLENIYARQIGSLLQGKGWNIGKHMWNHHVWNRRLSLHHHFFVGAKFFAPQKVISSVGNFGSSTCVGNIPKRFFRNPTRWAPKSPVMK